MHLNKKDFLALIILFTSIVSVKAQIYRNPFSQYGIGELSPSNQANDMGMGGTFYTQTDPNRYNFANPASYSNINYFSFELGGAVSFYNHTDGNVSFSNFDPEISYISIAFPIDTAKKWGLSFGIMPYSTLGYQYESNSFSDSIRQTIYRTGTGGLNKFYIGSSIRLLHNLIVGANANLIFGNEQTTFTQSFPDSATLYGVHQTTSNLTAGIAFDIGATYNINFKVPYKSENPDLVNYYSGLKDSMKRINRLIVKGVYNTSTHNLNAKKDSLTHYLKIIKDSIRSSELPKNRNYTIQLGGTCNLPSYLSTTQTIDAYTFSSYYTISDSLSQYQNQKGNILSPLGFGGSIELASEQNWKIAATAEYRQWSRFQGLIGSSDSLNNYYSVGLGAQFTPRRESGNNLWSTTNYRFGFRYAQMPYIVNGNKVNQIGFSIGAGIPIAQKDLRLINRYAEPKAKNWPYVDVALEFGQEGSLSTNKLQQKYVALSLGFHLFEVNWFQKHKLD